MSLLTIARLLVVVLLSSTELIGDPPHAPQSGSPGHSPGGRALVKAPVRGAPPELTDSAEMGFQYPFEKTGSKGGADAAARTVMNTVAKIEGDTLTIALTESAGYQAFAMGFKFAPVMDGTETYFSDSDAAQVVVQWKDKDGKVVGRSTNATAQKPKRDPEHPAAEWKRVDGTPPKLVWNTKIPKGATQMEIVSVYTDTLTDTPAQAPRDKKRVARSGDMPLVVASFSGKLDGETWKVGANQKDIEQSRKFDLGKNPTVPQLEATIDAVRQLVQKRTGYSMVRRPASLEGINAPDEDGIGVREIQKKVDSAVKAGEIVNGHDTGFDIDPKSEDVPPVEKK